MRTTFAMALACACAVGFVGWSPGAARADTFPLIGMQTNGGGLPRHFDWNYWSEGAIGAVKTQETIAHYVTPVYWRTFPSGNRTMRVRGKRTSASKPIFCNLLVIDQDGFVVSQDWDEFTTVGSYSWITLTVSGVTTNTNSFLSCELPPNDGYLLMMSYTP